jgi:hypothetical protein
MTSSEPETNDTVDTEALERSQQAIDEGNDAARAALDDPSPDLDGPGTGRSAEDTEGEPAPRPS